MHEQPLGVDAIGRTGDQGDEILAVLDGQVVRLIWEDHLGRRDPIGVILSEDADDEPVPDLELGQAVEDASGRKPRVTGEDAVGGIPTNGKGGARHVPDAMIHAVSIDPVVDGEVDAYAGYDELAHDTVPNQVEHALVLLVAGRSRVWVKWVGHVDAARADALVEVLRLLPFRREVLGRGAGHGILLPCLDLALLDHVEVVAHVGVRDERDAHEHGKKGEDGLPRPTVARIRGATREDSPRHGSIRTILKVPGHYSDFLRRRDAATAMPPTTSMTPAAVRPRVPTLPVIGSMPWSGSVTLADC